MGNERLSASEVESILNEYGFGVGSVIKGTDLKLVENRVMNGSEEIAWVSVNMNGTVARVEVIESKKGEVKSSQPANLVSKRDGKIERIEAYNGNVEVKVGDVVRAGEVLVGGVYKNETGEYITHIYAEDRAGNITSLALNGVQVRNDTQKPIISDVRYSDVSAAGYTISCKVIDDWGVSSVSFPTWTIQNGQDDLPANFLQTQLGTKNGNRYTFRVNASAHNNETGEYATHIYATDCAGNQVSLALDTVMVMNDREKPVISDAKITNVTPEGYTVTCTVTDNWGVSSVAFPTWTEYNGQDDLAEDFLNTQQGKKNGDTYTFDVLTSKHNNELGIYHTHIYATDCAGNQVNIELQIVVGAKIELLGTSSYTLDNGFVIGVRDQVTVGSLLANFDNTGLEAVDAQGNALMDSDFVGTGTKISLLYGNDVLDTVTVVVRGDLDGNGIVDTTDYMRVKSALRGTFEIDEAQRKAADADQNDKINATDHVRIKSYFLGTFDLFE